MNILCCLAVLSDFNLNTKNIQKFFKNQKPLKGRGKIKKVKRFGKTFYLIQKTQSGSFKLKFTDDTFWIGVICLFIYWFLWGNEKKN